MSKQRDESPSTEPKPHGIDALPPFWAAAVRLIGTFGLAVFLVLYYVFVIRVEEKDRYEKLAASVGSLVEVVEKERTLLPSSLENRLQELWVRAMSPELATILARAGDDEAAHQAAADRIRETLIEKTVLLRGFTRRDGRDLADMVSSRAQFDDLAERLVEAASVEDWPKDDPASLSRAIADFLLHRMVFVATSAK